MILERSSLIPFSSISLGALTYTRRSSIKDFNAYMRKKFNWRESTHDKQDT